ncbi:protein-L-isoaspartate(D-aspartate) O-methyltransferase [Nonomuraea salmonea]|jgi:protein-L-isoaspartate(D-aspartate) O-methyltransferase|uniref:Protein-L-isoaspartate O-methyltransferase n=1 Tax=Nonomuraea salmonea TaxID=46181 RepID=A0ABV5NU89_9ACTN
MAVTGALPAEEGLMAAARRAGEARLQGLMRAARRAGDPRAQELVAAAEGDCRSLELVTAAERAGIHDLRLLAAIAATPRELFVPPRSAGQACLDVPIPLAHGQPTSQPSLVAQMIDALRLTGAETVLEIGTGYGYQTALLARLARHVHSIERLPDLAAHARANLAAAGITGAEVLAGDGSAGLPEHAPYDAVIVSAAAPHVPAALAEQLAEGGRLVMPVTGQIADIVTLFTKQRGHLASLRELTPASFVPLIPGP